MTTVTVIGTGNMGQAIGIVVLAVPYPAVSDIIATRGYQLVGKVGLSTPPTR